MKEMIMYMVGYDESFRKAVDAGWGCGYVMIPLVSELGKAMLVEKAKYEVPYDGDEDGYVPKYYPRFYHGQECTYFEAKLVNDENYLVAGFDTAHSSNSNSDDFAWVFKQTCDMLKAYQKLEEDLTAKGDL